MSMLQAVTTYDKFRDVGWVTGVSHSNNYNYAINDEFALRDTRLFCDRWVANDNYSISKDEFLPALLSVLREFIFFPDTVETGLTYSSRNASSVMIKPEEEIELRVKMAPQATRDVMVVICARSKGKPNPILL